jgi:hypothetical protein
MHMVDKIFKSQSRKLQERFFPEIERYFNEIVPYPHTRLSTS